MESVAEETSIQGPAVVSGAFLILQKVVRDKFQHYARVFPASSSADCDPLSVQKLKEAFKYNVLKEI